MRNCRSLRALLLCLLLVASLAFTAAASDDAPKGNVVYLGKADQFLFAPGSDLSPTDLFPNLKNVMPGDTLTEQVVIRNGIRDKQLKVFMRSLGAQEDTEDFLSQMTLTITQATNTELFEAPANETAQLTDWVSLGTIGPGGKITLNLTLEVPITMGDDYQNHIGYIDWEFKVEERPLPETPKTGDMSNIYLYVGLLTVSAAALFLLLLLKKRRKEED